MAPLHPDFVLGLLDDFAGRNASRDPFSAVVPFATSSDNIAPGKRHRDMPIDVNETDKAIEVIADIHGVSKEDIQLDIDHDILTLSVTAKSEVDEDKEEGGQKWHHIERSHSFVKRSLRLPKNSDKDNVAAAYDQGVLKVRVPKTEMPPTSRRINVS